MQGEGHTLKIKFPKLEITKPATYSGQLKDGVSVLNN
jgi:hypothetical protein